MCCAAALPWRAHRAAEICASMRYRRALEAVWAAAAPINPDPNPTGVLSRGRSVFLLRIRPRLISVLRRPSDLFRVQDPIELRGCMPRRVLSNATKAFFPVPTRTTEFPRRQGFLDRGAELRALPAFARMSGRLLGKPPREIRSRPILRRPALPIRCSKCGKTPQRAG